MKRVIACLLLLALLAGTAYGAVESGDTTARPEETDTETETETPEPETTEGDDLPQDPGDVTDYSIFDEAEPVLAAEDITIDVPYAILMEKETGQVIYEKEADTVTPPASVTKVMTILLIVEELDKGALTLEDMVTASATAAGMGGSQIYLKEGEQMTVHDMLKSIVVSSANDCSVAMAEHLMGTEEAFVARMNERAAELGMENTTFINCTGLPIDGRENQTTARDIALMSRELVGHEIIRDYSTIWMDTVRDGEFGLSNTNKLIHYYDGATGLKTGFTQEAGYCLAATAERDGVEYIAVVLKGETSDQRFEAAKTLLSYAFANYTLVNVQPDEVLHPIPVELGAVDYVQPILAGGEKLLLEKSAAATVTKTVEVAESVQAPVTAGQNLGTLKVYDGDTELASIPIVAGDSVEKITVLQIFGKFMHLLFTGGL